MDYLYKVVSLGSYDDSRETFDSDMPSKAENVLNDMSQKGWEYVNNITPSVNSQYFDNTIGHILLVFRRIKNGDKDIEMTSLDS